MGLKGMKLLCLLLVSSLIVETLGANLLKELAKGFKKGGKDKDQEEEEEGGKKHGHGHKDKDGEGEGDSDTESATEGSDHEHEHEEESECSTCPKVEFVISAKQLPEMKQFLAPEGPPDPFVEVEYYSSAKASKPRKFVTSHLQRTHNPEWPDIFKVIYREGHGQRFKFIVKTKMISAHEIGHVVISLKDIVKSAPQFEKELVGTALKSGSIIVFPSIDGQITDDTDLRLANKPPKGTHVFKIDSF